MNELTPGGLRSSEIASTEFRGKALKKFCKTMTPRCYEIPTENDVMDLFLTGCRFIDFEDCNGNSHKQTLNDTKFLNLSSDRYFNLLFPYHEKHYQKYFKGKWILSVRLSEFFFFSNVYPGRFCR